MEPLLHGVNCKQQYDGNHGQDKVWPIKSKGIEAPVKQYPWLEIRECPPKNVQSNLSASGPEKDPSDAAEGEGTQNLE